MTARAAPLAVGGTTPRPHRPARDARGVLTVIAVLLLLLPARMVVAPLGGAGTPATIVASVALVWWLCARMVPSSAPPPGGQPVRVAMVMLAGSILLSYAVASLHALPGDQVAGADRGLLALAAWAGVALVAADLLTSAASVEQVIRRLVVFGVVLAGLGVVQFCTGIDIAAWFRIPGLTTPEAASFIDTRGVLRRVSGTASHPIEFGMVLVLILPFAFHVATVSRRHRALWGLGTVLILVAIPMSVSRSAILGLVTVFVFLFAAWSPRRRLAAIVLAPVFLVGMRLLIPGLVGTISSIFGNAADDPSLQGRTDDYGQVGELIARSPIVGRGFGTFLPHDFFFLDNQYLGTIIETGFVGLAAVVAVLAIGIGLGRGIRRRSPDGEGRMLGQCFAAAFAAAAIGLGTFDAFGFSMFTGVLFLLLGCAGASWRLVRQPDRRAAPVTEPARRPPSMAP